MIIIGAGRVGQALAARDPSATLIDRETHWEALEDPRRAGEAIVLAVRNDDLDEVLLRVPSTRRADLVFVQNGMLRDWLWERGLQGSTRGLLFFAVPRRGEDLVAGADSPFCGPHAAGLVTRFRRCAIPAVELDEAAFFALELEKLIWNCTFGLLCERHACSVGEVVAAHEPQLRALVGEMRSVCLKVFASEAPPLPELPRLLDRLCAYSRSIADYRGALKEWRWRNGWFVARARRGEISMPVHRQLLVELGRESELES